MLHKENLEGRVALPEPKASETPRFRQIVEVLRQLSAEMGLTVIVTEQNANFMRTGATHFRIVQKVFCVAS